MEREDKVKRMQALGALIWKPTIVPSVDIEVKDKDGNVIIFKSILCESHNRNFFNFLAMVHGRCGGTDTTFGSGHLNLKDSSATVYNPTILYSFAFLATAGLTSYGIVVGSGTDAESFSGYVIPTLIAHGTGSGQMSYQAMTFPSHTWTAGTLTWEIDQARVFNNNSGGSITINALALYHGNYISNWRYIMMLHDKLDSGVNVPDAGQLTVTYHLQLVYPE